MAQKQITELPSATTPDGSELVLVRQDVYDKKLDLVGLKDYLQTDFDARYANESLNFSDVDSAVTAFDNVKQPATTTYSGAVELATVTEAVDGVDTTRATTPEGVAAAIAGQVPTASTVTQGKVELATNAETKTGTDTTRAITPSALKALFDDMFVGQVATFAMGTAPEGWFKCNGQAVSRTTYAKLFAKIGTTYGVGDGSTTFNVPECRGEAPRYFDDGRGIDSGRVLGSWQEDQSLHVSNFDTTTGGYTDVSEGTIPTNGNWSSFRASGRSHDNNNSGIRFKMNAAETRPRNIAFLACIKY